MYGYFLTLEAIFFETSQVNRPLEDGFYEYEMYVFVHFVFLEKKNRHYVQMLCNTSGWAVLLLHVNLACKQAHSQELTF